MKKMIAILLVLCLLPSVAFAKDMSWTWTGTIIGGKYYNSLRHRR